MLTVRHHVRSARDLGVPIFAHRSGLHEFEGGDVEVEGYDALAFGDGVVNYGELGHPPDQFLGDDPAGVKADIVEGLVPLLDEDFDALLFAHGDPVASGGKAMLRALVESWR